MVEELEPKSKSQVKKEMIALQAIGEQLVELTPNQLSKIEMPAELRDALLFARTIKKGEARRRQLQYIGVLMREADPEPIKKALDSIGRGWIEDAAQFNEIERWRDELISGRDDLLEEIMNRFPGADRRLIRQLVLSARKERKENKPPKASRALFRLLKAIQANS